jgi:hypothetical protein
MQNAIKLLNLANFKLKKKKKKKKNISTPPGPGRIKD